MKTFVVVSSTESKSVPGTFNNKIKHTKVTPSPLGDVVSSETYYIRTNKQFEEGHSFEMDLSKYKVEPFEYTTPEGKELTLHRIVA